MARHMPGMDGLETTRQIRAAPGCASLPIVAMTADIVGSAREECLRAGMNDFVSKPFSPSSLFAVIAHWATANKTQPATGDLEPPAQSSDGAIPAALPGLDIREGLALMGGDRPMYLRLLRQFPELYATSDQRISAFLAEGKLDDAAREAHSVKGLAGQMGAQQLYRNACRLESALRSASPETAAALRAFADSLALVNAGLIAFAEAKTGREAPVSEEKTVDALP